MGTSYGEDANRMTSRGGHDICAKNSSRACIWAAARARTLETSWLVQEKSLTLHIHGGQVTAL